MLFFCCAITWVLVPPYSAFVAPSTYIQSHCEQAPIGALKRCVVLNFYIHLLSQQLPDIDIWILTHISLNLAPVPLQATKDKGQARQKRQRQRQKASEGQNSRFSHLDHTDTHTIYVHEHKKAQFFVAFKNSHKLILFIFTASREWAYSLFSER